MSPPGPHPSSAGTLGVIAGGGEVPLRVARAAQASGRPVFVVALEGWANPVDFMNLPHLVQRVGAVGAIFDRLRAEGATELVLAGRVARPSLAALRPDAGGVRILARLGRAFFAGDDGLISAGIQALEAEGFRVLPVQEVLRDIMPEAGLLAGAAPDAMARADIARGIAVLRALGAVDVGQAVVVQQGLVLGVEAIEGTDALLARSAELRREGPGGVLVKLLKPGQDRRMDLPTIGPQTIRGAAAAGLRGIVVEAGGSILVDRPATLAAAGGAGLFLLAIHPESFNPEETTP